MPRIFSEEKLGVKRVNGFYETPLETVKYIVGKIIPFWEKGMKILDPAVGDGVFLYALQSSGIPREYLYGFDIDEKKVRLLKQDFPNVSLFDSTNPFLDKYDFVVGNPPYNGDESHFVRKNRSRLKKLYGEIGAKNTFSMISYQAIKSLKPDGVFSMILSDAFMTNIYYKKFRDFLLKNTEIQEMLLAPWKLFHHISADVRTCILTVKKLPKQNILEEFPLFTNSSDYNNKLGNDVRLVDRIETEEEYNKPDKVEIVKQREFLKYPNNVFLVGIPSSIRSIYLDTNTRLGDVVEGGTGISTGNDKKYLKKRDEVEGSKKWVPYYKNGARQKYWYFPEYFIEKDYQKHKKVVKNYLVRNEKLFFREGITCSSVGIRFSAAFMPEGGLFGVNANFFPKDRNDIYYILGLLNSKLAWYFTRRVLVRTNNISSNYLRLLPYKEPCKKEKSSISHLVKGIVKELKKNSDYNFDLIQRKLDDKFFNIYNIDKDTKKEVNGFCNDFYNKM